MQKLLRVIKLIDSDQEEAESWSESSSFHLRWLAESANELRRNNWFTKSLIERSYIFGWGRFIQKAFDRCQLTLLVSYFVIFPVHLDLPTRLSWMKIFARPYKDLATFALRQRKENQICFAKALDKKSRSFFSKANWIRRGNVIVDIAIHSPKRL